MKQLLISIVLILTSSCSTFKHRAEIRSGQTAMQFRDSSIYDSLSVLLHRGSRQLLNENNMEWTEILPIGPFSYKPDSGFSGQAAKITVYRQQERRLDRQDSAAAKLLHLQRQTVLDSQLQRAEQLDKRLERASDPVSVYPYIAAAAVIVALVLFLKYGYR